MTAGNAEAHAHGILNLFRGVTYTGVTIWVQLHTGDPGAAGTANVSAVTDRHEATFDAPSGGVMELSAALAAWSMTTSETLRYVSLWDAETGGNFKRSIILLTGKDVVNGDTFTLNTLTLSASPLAA